MHPSSTGVLLGFSALVIQPSSVLPSKRSSQPSAFSLAVSSLSAARTDRRRARAVQEQCDAHRGLLHRFGAARGGAQCLLLLVQLPQPAVGVEDRRRQGLGQRAPRLRRSGPSGAVPWPRKTGRPLPQGDDLAPGAALRGVRPAADPLVEVEEHRHHLADVVPVAGVVGLDDEQPARDQAAVDQRQERRRDQPAVDLGRVVVRLRVVAVDFADASAARRSGRAARRPPPTAKRTFVRPALVAALAGVADDDRQGVDAEVVVVRARQTALPIRNRPLPQPRSRTTGAVRPNRSASRAGRRRAAPSARSASTAPGRGFRRRTGTPNSRSTRRGCMSGSLASGKTVIPMWERLPPHPEPLCPAKPGRGTLRPVRASISLDGPPCLLFYGAYVTQTQRPRDGFCRLRPIRRPPPVRVVPSSQNYARFPVPSPLGRLWPRPGGRPGRAADRRPGPRPGRGPGRGPGAEKNIFVHMIESVGWVFGPLLLPRVDRRSSPWSCS